MQGHIYRGTLGEAPTQNVFNYLYQDSPNVCYLRFKKKKKHNNLSKGAYRLHMNSFPLVTVKDTIEANSAGETKCVCWN